MPYVAEVILRVGRDLGVVAVEAGLPADRKSRIITGGIICPRSSNKLRNCLSVDHPAFRTAPHGQNSMLRGLSSGVALVRTPERLLELDELLDVGEHVGTVWGTRIDFFLFLSAINLGKSERKAFALM